MKEGSELPIPTTQHQDVFKYNMNHEHRGIAIIFNHFKFENEKQTGRDGTYENVNQLKKALNLLGFKDQHIKVKNDLKAQEIIEYPAKMSMEDREILKDSDCIVIFVLSHGTYDNKIWAYDTFYNLHELIEQYNPNKFQEMAGKPKLFIINACRGAELDAGVKLQTIIPNTSHDVFTDCIDPIPTALLYPDFADILIGFSSYREHVTRRNLKYGSHYIQQFCKAITHYKNNNNLHSVDITEILTYTHYLLSKLEKYNKDEQGNSYLVKLIPNFKSALCGELCFTEKINV